MLVLNRKKDQWVKITHKSGDILMIKISDIRPNRVTIAFEGDDFRIDREEYGLDQSTSRVGEA